MSTYMIVVLSIASLLVTGSAAGKASEKEKQNDSTSSQRSLSFSEIVKFEVENEESSPSEIGSQSTPEWKEAHGALEENGISLSVGYKADNFSNISGGVEQRGSYLHNIVFVAAVDLEKTLHWSGAGFLFQILNSNGGGFSQRVGSAQSVSNIDAPSTTKLHQAFFQQDLLDGKILLLAGLYDLKSEFYITKHSVLFLNGSFGVGKELSQTGKNGSPLYPNSAAALRVILQPSTEWAFRFVAIDAVPGTPGDPTSPSFAMSTEEGALVIGEMAYRWSGAPKENIGEGRYTFGAWFYTASFDEVQAIALTGQSHRSTANNGVYFMAEQHVFTEPGDAGQGLSLFSRVGFANGKINRFNYNLSVGATYTGLFSGRDGDTFGFALTHANNSAEYTRVKSVASEPYATAELAFEITYRLQVTPWLALQPDLQHIIHPGTNPDLDNATVFGARFEVGF